MPNNETVQPKLSIFERLGFKLGTLFVIGFLATVILGLVWDVFISAAEKTIAEAQTMGQPSTVAIDPKLEGELAKVINFDAVQSVNQAKDPFNDRNNLAGQKPAAVTTASQTSSNTQPATAQVTKANSSDTKKQTSSSTAAKTQATGGSRDTLIPVKATSISSVEATMARLEARNKAIREGREVPPESTIFAIEDLLPIGLVGGGIGGDQVMFYSQALERSVSFEMGARFFDGWLVGVKPEGIEFSNYGQNSTIVRPWERDIKARTAQSVSVIDAPLGITGGNE